MRQFICDNCNKETDEQSLFNLPLSLMVFNETDMGIPKNKNFRIVTKYIDLCPICFHLYSEEANRLYRDFTHALNIRNQ